MTIPRGVVAEALNVPEDDLPPGDLPLERFAARYLRCLAAPDAEEPPEAWTQLLILDLTERHPRLALDAIRAAVERAPDADSVAMIAAGPLEDLLAEHGPGVVGAMEQAATGSPRLAFALSGVGRDRLNPFVGARIEALFADGPRLDRDNLPPA